MSVSKKVRQSLPPSKMGMPGQDKYPMPNKAHAVNAKARARQMLNKGKLSWVEHQRIARKADAVIADAENKSEDKKDKKGEA